MIKIHHPMCSCCDSARAEYRHEQHESLLLCYGCILSMSTWMVNHNLHEDNPWLAELAKGVWREFGEGDSKRQEIVKRNPDESYGYLRIKHIDCY